MTKLFTNFKKYLIDLGKLDRRYIFLLIGLSVLIPLIKPNWINIPIKTTNNSQIVFNELNKLNEGDKVLVSFEYGASTKPEIHPMSVAVLQHLFSKGVKVYTVPLWPEGLMMAKYALQEVVDSELFNITEHIDFVSLPYKAGGEIIIRGIATDLRSIFTQDVNNILLEQIPMMEGVNKISDFDFNSPLPEICVILFFLRRNSIPLLNLLETSLERLITFFQFTEKSLISIPKEAAFSIK